MDWWFHILFALLLYNGDLSIGWFLLGNVVLDIFFVISFLSVAGIRPRSLSEILKFDNHASKTIWHKIGYFGHSFMAMLIFLVGTVLGGPLIKSLCYGLVLHQVIDFATHNKIPNPIFYPFTMKRYPIGFVHWDLRNKNITIPTLQILSILFLLKYFFFDFII